MSEEQKPKKPETTIRANVTPDEHEAVWWFARKKMSQTIDQVVKAAVDEYMKKNSGRSIAETSEYLKSRGKMVQMELF